MMASWTNCPRMPPARKRWPSRNKPATNWLQRSTRYPGGVALRFARVLRYRDDKAADEADTIETVLALSPRV